MRVKSFTPHVEQRYREGYEKLRLQVEALPNEVMRTRTCSALDTMNKMFSPVSSSTSWKKYLIEVFCELGFSDAELKAVNSMHHGKKMGINAIERTNHSKKADKGEENKSGNRIS